MKKLIPGFMALVLALAFVGCGEAQNPSTSDESQTEISTSVEESSAEESSVEESTEEDTEESTEESTEEADAANVMTYAEYAAADVDTEVVVETYVQAKQSWWDNKATVYGQDQDGAIFMYNMACSAQDYDRLSVGTKIRVTGYKTVWQGEVEITDATFEIIEGNYVAEAQDVTALLNTDELLAHQNEFVSFKDMTVVAAGQDENGKDVAFLYNWDGSGEEGNDLYFKVSSQDVEYTFTVESYLCGSGTDAYEAVKNLKIGDVIDLEGFLYWYEGANPHITSVTVK